VPRVPRPSEAEEGDDVDETHAPVDGMSRDDQARGGRQILGPPPMMPLPKWVGRVRREQFRNPAAR